MAESDIPEFNPMTPPSPVDAPPMAGAAPPTYRPAYQRPSQSSWPNVVGIICIVMGSLGALGGFCGVIGSFFQGYFANMMPAGQANVMTGMAQYMPYMIASNVLNLALAVTLIIGGTGLTSRRRWGRPVLLHWSWLKMIAVIVGAVLGYYVQQAQLQAMLNDPNAASAPPQMGMFMQLGAGIGLAIGVVWGWILPIFVLIWLNRQTIRDEANSWS